jgi:uncharacterized membrane protein YbhN (UPF0104 family)
MTRGTVLRAALGLGLLGLVVAQADVGDARRSLTRANGSWIAWALVAQLVAKACWAFRWSAILRAAGHARRVVDLFGVVLVGLFFGSFLPSSVGGDVARGWALASRGVPLATAAASVVAERLIGVIALAVAATAGAVLGRAGASPWLSAGVALAVGLSAWSLASRPTIAAGVLPRLPAALRGRARRMLDALSLVAGRRDLLLVALGWSVLLMAASALFHWSLGRAIALRVPFAAWLVIVPAVMLISTIPLTPNGLGFREAGFVGFLAAQGVPASEAAVFAVLALLVPLPLTLAGGVMFAAGERPTGEAGEGRAT